VPPGIAFARRPPSLPSPARGEGEMMVKRGLLVALVVLVLDQLTKWWILSVFGALPPAERGRSFTDFFNLVLVWNRGVSFGLFNNDAGVNAIVFSALAAVIVVALVVWLTRIQAPILAAAIGLVIGGAIGNVIDRLRLGAVVDFLDFHVGLWHWPAFNVADSAICIGVGLILLDGLLPRRETRTKGAGV
jgi:signal peptidase II